MAKVVARREDFKRAWKRASFKTGVTSGPKGGRKERSLEGRDVAIGRGDLTDESMSPQKTIQVSDFGGDAFATGDVELERVAVKNPTQIAVAQAGGGAFPAGDGHPEGDIGRVADPEGSGASVAVRDGLVHAAEDFGTGGPVPRGDERLQIALLGPLGDFDPAMEVCGALAQNLPVGVPLGILEERVKDLEVLSLREGGFDTRKCRKFGLLK